MNRFYWLVSRNLWVWRALSSLLTLLLVPVAFVWCILEGVWYGIKEGAEEAWDIAIDGVDYSLSKKRWQKVKRHYDKMLKPVEHEGESVG